MNGELDGLFAEAASEGARLAVDAEDRLVVVHRVVGVFDDTGAVLGAVVLQHIRCTAVKLYPLKEAVSYSCDDLDLMNPSN